MINIDTENSTQKLFALYRPGDLNDGRGPEVLMGLFTSKEEAKLVNNNPHYFGQFGIMGCRSEAEYYIREFDVKIFDSAGNAFRALLKNPEEACNELHKQLRRKAILEKLTPEEIQDLNIPDEPSTIMQYMEKMKYKEQKLKKGIN